MSAVSSSTPSSQYDSQIEALKQAAGNNPTYDQQLDEWQKQIDAQQSPTSGGASNEDEGYAGDDDSSSSGVAPVSKKSAAPVDEGYESDDDSTSTPSKTSTSTSTASTSNSDSTGYTGNVEADLNANLKAKFGFSDAQLAGIDGNIEQESGFKPDVNQGGQEGAPSGDNADDNANGYGLAQWGGARKEAEEAYAKQNNEDPGSEQANIGFIDQELEGSYSGAVSAVKSSSNPDGAALAWDEKYEQASAPNMTARDQYADQAYSQMGSGSSTS